MLLICSGGLHSEEFSAGCSTHTAPFCFSTDGKVGGVIVDIVNEITRRMDSSVSMQATPMKRLQRELKEGVVDISGPMIYNEDRASYLYFLRSPIFTIRQGVYGIKGNNYDYYSIGDLSGRTLGKRRGFYLSENLEMLVEEGKVKVLESNSFNQLFNQLFRGRVDYIALPRGIVALRRSSLSDEVIFLGYLGGETKLSIGISKYGQLKSNVDEVERIFQEMQSDGSLEEIIYRYFRSGTLGWSDTTGYFSIVE
ncbi:substrate-binding periplasmic protein [Vibrio profundum]|uniref:substrate-binding periplasmic protein n=1 Tax=Vibrio profundum TaxID=2910247 RepID=UPI003D0D2132